MDFLVGLRAKINFLLICLTLILEKNKSVILTFAAEFFRILYYVRN